MINNNDAISLSLIRTTDGDFSAANGALWGGRIGWSGAHAIVLKQPTGTTKIGKRIHLLTVFGVLMCPFWIHTPDKKIV